MKIYAPVVDFNGSRNGVRFVNGVGETENSQVAEWFQQRGYNVEVKSQVLESEEELTDIGKNVDDSEPTIVERELPDLDAMSPFELRQWAIDNGYGAVIRNTRSKDKLIELIRG